MLTCVIVLYQQYCNSTIIILELCNRCTDSRLRCLAHGDFIVPRMRLRLTDTSFTVSERKACNTLPSNSRSISNILLAFCSGCHRDRSLGRFYCCCTLRICRLVRLVESFVLQPQIYTDDTQIYGSCRPSATDDLQSSVTNCVVAVAD